MFGMTCMLPSTASSISETPMSKKPNIESLNGFMPLFDASVNTITPPINISAAK